jgi:hypothetical protein
MVPNRLGNRVKPHETCTFCTCREKLCIFSAFFAVLPLRYIWAFAIFPNGPSLFPEK